MRDWEKRHGYVAVEIPAAGVARLSTRATPTTRSGRCCTASSRAWPSSPESWHAYRDANERFADAVVARMRPRDLIWVHDYQLMLVPQHAAGACARGPRRLLPAHPVPVIRDLPHPARARGHPAGSARLGLDRLPDARRPAQLPALAAAGAGPRKPDGRRPCRWPDRLAGGPAHRHPDRRVAPADQQPNGRSRGGSRTCANDTSAASSSSRWTASTTPRASPSACAPSAAC